MGTEMDIGKSYAIVSAPGKVLITGGYLILEPTYSGLVIATDSRFYTIVRAIGNENNGSVVRVKSPQFLDGLWEFNVVLKDFGRISLESRIENQPSNKYVEYPILFSLELIRHINSKIFDEKMKSGIEIIILGHNDFYSQRQELARNNLPLTTPSLKTIEPFASTHTEISKVNKTGLGSSAAMMTSLIGSILSFFSIVDLSISHAASITDTQLVHNLTQFCHCLAQGKIGSGFDVSSAVFGSHVYKRFSPSVLETLLATTVSSITPSDLYNVVHPNSTSQSWDARVDGIDVPPGLTLMLADIDAGSSTPKLVSQVLAWRKQNPELANNLWDSIYASNQEVEKCFRVLIKIANEHRDEYREGLLACSQISSAQWHTLPSTPTISSLISLRNAFLTTRTLLQQMSKAAQVPIEPAQQTKLLDTMMQVPGVVMCGVPGAGGFDAIFCLAISITDKPIHEVESVWKSWSEMSVCPLLARQDCVLPLNGSTNTHIPTSGISGVKDYKSIPGLERYLQS